MIVPGTPVASMSSQGRASSRGRILALRPMLATPVIALLCSALAASDPSAESRIAFPREVYVPADQPSAWPSGRWLARPTEEYRRMLADLANQQPAPPRAMFSRATYTATFARRSFNGRFRADVALRGSEAAFLSLGEPTLALHQLDWHDQPAVWGLTPGGKHVLRVDADDNRLQGMWSLRGRELFGRIEFDVTLPPAMISTLELRLPAEKRLMVSANASVQVTPDSTPGWRTWTLNLGQQTHLQVVVSEEPDRPASSVTFVERESHYSLMPDGLSLEAVFQFDNLSEGTDRLTFVGASDMEFTSVVVGNERELPFQRSQDDAGALVQVPVASISWQGRVSVRVLGKMPLPAEGSWTLPRVFLKALNKTVTRSGGSVSSEADGSALTGPGLSDRQTRPPGSGATFGPRARFDVVSSKLYVTVHRPLELRDFSVIDCRLITSTMVQQQTDRLEFEDWSDASQITVTWDVPRADLIADVITAVGGDDLRLTSRTLLQLSTRSGSTYELSCHVPRNWQVTHVTSAPWHRSQMISSWRTQTAEDGSAELLVELRDALKPGDLVFVEIGASRLSGEGASANPVAWLTPQVAELRRVDVAIQPVAKRQVVVPPTSSFRPTNSAHVREQWSQAIGDWDRWLRDSFGQTTTSHEPLYFVAENPSELDVQIVRTGESADSRDNAQEGLDASPVDAHQMTLAPPDGASGDGRPARTTLMADVTIHTRVPADPGQPSLQTAYYRIHHPGAGSGTELSFALAAPGELISARLEGSQQGIALSEQTVHLELPADQQSVLVEIHYRTPFAQSFLWGFGEIPLPRADLAVTGMRWHIDLPESFRLRSSTDGTTYRPRPSGWRQRLLGPLARAAALPATQPWQASDEQETRIGEKTSPEVASSIMGSTPSLLAEAHDSDQLRSLPFTAQTLRVGIWKEDWARRLGWVLLVVALLTIGFAGRLPSRWCFTIKSAGVAATLLTAIVVPASLAIPCGGLFLGALMGAVLPRRIASRHEARDVEPRSMGTTRIVARALTPLFLLALGVSNEMRAFQLEDSPTAPSTTSPQAETGSAGALPYEAMIPVRSGKPTLEESAVVYVRPSLLSRWHALKKSGFDSPPYLLREARYVVSDLHQATPRVAAVFDVLLLEAPATHRIALPLTEIAIDDDPPCRVNGRKATVIPLQAGSGIVVELPSLQQAAFPEEQSDVLSEPDPDPAQSLRIELGFRPNASEAKQRRHLQFGIPPVLASTAEVHDRTDDAERTVASGFGSTSVSVPDGHLVAELGPVRRLEIIEDNALPSTDEAALIPDRALSSIELHPRQLAVRTRLRFRVAPQASEQSPTVVEVRLPVQAAVSEVKAPALIKSNVRRVAGEPTGLQLAFAELRSDRFEVEVAFTLPGVYSAMTSVIPAFPFFEAMGSPSSTRHMVAITPRSGFRVAASEAVEEGLTPAPAAQFQQLWDLSGTVNPDLVYSLTAPRSFPIEVTPIQPVREASVAETLAWERSQIQWKADVELECRSAPVAVHKLQIDPRVQIITVRVVQEGLERPIRWFRGEGSELTILLSDDLIGRQSIALTGNLPAALNQSVEIPRLKIPGIPLLQHELRLQSPPGWTVEVFSEDGTVLANRPDLANHPEDAVFANQEVADEPNRSFDLNSETPPKRMRVNEHVSRFEFERIVSLHARQADQMRMRTLFRLREGRPPPSRMEFDVPAAWTRHGPLTTQPELIRDRTREDGRSVYVLDTRSQIPRFGVVEFAATVPTPVADLWTVPMIEAVGGSSTGERLVLSGQIRFDVEGNARNVAVDGELLDTIRLPEESESIYRRAFASARPDWKLLPTSRFSATGHVRRMESSIWEVPQYGVAGITSALVTLHQRDDVIIELPTQLELVLAVWDGVPISLPAEQPSSLTIPAALISPRSAPHQLIVWWTQVCSPFQIRRTIPLPRIAQLPATSESVAFLGSERSLYEAGAAWKPVPEGAQLNANPATEPQENPIDAALQAAGIPARARHAASPIRISTAILRGQIDRDERKASSGVTVWCLRRDWQRGLLAALLAMLLLILWANFKSSPMLRNGAVRAEIRTYGGPLLLSIMLWTMGPSLIGLGLFVLVSVAWVGSAWRRRVADTTFEVDSEVLSYTVHGHD